MSSTIIERDLGRFGPGLPPDAAPCAIEDAREYCRGLARTHYENFTVASWLLPRRLRQHFYHLYAYCRWADDLADETADPAQSLALLDWWETELRDCYDGRARHPVFVALRETIDTFGIPIEPFADLLVAFRQDQRVTRYESVDAVLDYCRNSANPVGRLVLYLGRSVNERNLELSDSVCTGLQLANFCQDVARDWDRGRIYLPLDACRQHGFTAQDFAGRRSTPAFRNLLSHEVDRADRYLQAGLPLASRVAAELSVDIALFIEGGLAILEAIRRIDYDVWTTRPRVTKWQQLWLLAGCWWNAHRGRSAEGPQ